VAVALLSFAVGQGPGFSRAALALSTLCSALMLPTPPQISTLPGALFPLNFPSWSIFFELIANLAFFYGLTALSGRRLAAFVALAFAGLCAVALRAGDLDVGYTWREVHAGLIRVMFAFPVGVLLYRRWIARAPGASGRFGSGTAGSLACLGSLTVLLILPVPAAVKPVYDVLVVACLFPMLVTVAAGITPGPRLTGLCLRAGAASYPLYILHAPCVAWIEAVGRRMPGVADRIAAPWAGLAMLAALLAACLVLVRVYDSPARRWLGRVAILRPRRASRALEAVEHS
jgi:peptidoglycan/LPS O-acetylase OafA/YrhL